MKRCKPPTDRKPCIIRSRFRSGTWELSAGFFRPLCERCPTLGITSRLAAPYERNLSVTMLFGDRPCFSTARPAIAWQPWYQGGPGRSRRERSRLDQRRAKTDVFDRQWKSPLRPDARCLSGRALSAHLPGVNPTEFACLSPDGFVRKDEAALQQHLLDKPQAQRKPEIQPHRIGDDLRWKAVVLVSDRRLANPAHLSPTITPTTT